MKKIPTLFKREFDEKTHKIKAIKNEITPGCETAFHEGVSTIKIDGSCTAIIKGKFYKRYDAKKGKPIPENAIKCQDEPDPVTGHLPCWVECDRDNPADKWFWKAYDYYVHNNDEPLTDGTYEAIGLYFNGNAYDYDYDTLIKHGERKCCVGRTFNEVKEWLETHDEEGIVFWYNGEPVCKIKRSDFGLPWKGSTKR